MKRPSLTTALTFAASTAALSIPFLAFADYNFVPLTSLPGIQDIAASPSLPGFINNLYRILIGVAAFAAIVQIAHAGYLFMSSNDSISKNTKAREKIMNAVIGLVLVLSPFIVFSIINKQILDISLDFSGLKSNNGTGADATFGAFSTDGNTVVTSVDSTSTHAAAGAACTKDGGTPVFQCKSGTETPYTVQSGQACKTGEKDLTTCTKPTNTDASTCTTKDVNTVVAPNGDTKYAAEGYVQVKDSCCSGMTAGNKCWQKPK